MQAACNLRGQELQARLPALQWCSAGSYGPRWGTGTAPSQAEKEALALNFVARDVGTCGWLFTGLMDHLWRSDIEPLAHELCGAGLEDGDVQWPFSECRALATSIQDLAQEASSLGLGGLAPDTYLDYSCHDPFLSTHHGLPGALLQALREHSEALPVEAEDEGATTGMGFEPSTSRPALGGSSSPAGLREWLFDVIDAAETDPSPSLDGSTALGPSQAYSQAFCCAVCTQLAAAAAAAETTEAAADNAAQGAASEATASTAAAAAAAAEASGAGLSPVPVGARPPLAAAPAAPSLIARRLAGLCSVLSASGQSLASTLKHRVASHQQHHSPLGRANHRKHQYNRRSRSSTNSGAQGSSSSPWAHSEEAQHVAQRAGLAVEVARKVAQVASSMSVTAASAPSSPRGARQQQHTRGGSSGLDDPSFDGSTGSSTTSSGDPGQEQGHAGAGAAGHGGMGVVGWAGHSSTDHMGGTSNRWSELSDDPLYGFADGAHIVMAWVRGTTSPAGRRSQACGRSRSRSRGRDSRGSSEHGSGVSLSPGEEAAAVPVPGELPQARAAVGDRPGPGLSPSALRQLRARCSAAAALLAHTTGHFAAFLSEVAEGGSAPQQQPPQRAPHDRLQPLTHAGGATATDRQPQLHAQLQLQAQLAQYQQLAHAQAQRLACQEQQVHGLELGLHSVQKDLADLQEREDCVQRRLALLEEGMEALLAAAHAVTAHAATSPAHAAANTTTAAAGPSSAPVLAATHVTAHLAQSPDVAALTHSSSASGRGGLAGAGAAAMTSPHAPARQASRLRRKSTTATELASSPTPLFSPPASPRQASGSSARDGCSAAGAAGAAGAGPGSGTGPESSSSMQRSAFRLYHNSSFSEGGCPHASATAAAAAAAAALAAAAINGGSRLRQGSYNSLQAGPAFGSTSHRFAEPKEATTTPLSPRVLSRNAASGRSARIAAAIAPPHVPVSPPAAPVAAGHAAGSDLVSASAVSPAAMPMSSGSAFNLAEGRAGRHGQQAWSEQEHLLHMPHSSSFGFSGQCAVEEPPLPAFPAHMLAACMAGRLSAGGLSGAGAGAGSSCPGTARGSQSSVAWGSVASFRETDPLPCDGAPWRRVHEQAGDEEEGEEGCVAEGQGEGSGSAPGSVAVSHEVLAVSAPNYQAVGADVQPHWQSSQAGRGQMGQKKGRAGVAAPGCTQHPEQMQGMQRAGGSGRFKRPQAQLGSHL